MDFGTHLRRSFKTKQNIAKQKAKLISHVMLVMFMCVDDIKTKAQFHPIRTRYWCIILNY